MVYAEWVKLSPTKRIKIQISKEFAMQILMYATKNHKDTKSQLGVL